MEFSEQTMIKLLQDVAEIKQGVLDMKNCKDDQELRIKELERYRDNAVGMVSVITVVGGFVVWVISQVISYFTSR
jgi:hypothetical protein